MLVAYYSLHRLIFIWNHTTFLKFWGFKLGFKSISRKLLKALSIIAFELPKIKALNQ